jgi:hypothetical protein
MHPYLQYKASRISLLNLLASTEFLHIYDLRIVLSTLGNDLGNKESRDFLLNCSYLGLRYESVPQAFHLYLKKEINIWMELNTNIDGTN